MLEDILGIAHSRLLIDKLAQLQVTEHSLDDHLAELAHHYARANNPERAVRYLTRAGKQALGRCAFGEAQAQLQQGLELIQLLPESSGRDAQELDLASTLAQVLLVLRGFSAPETRAGATRAAALAEKSGNLAALVQQLVAETINTFVRGDYSAAAALADQLLETAQREGSPASLGPGHSLQLQIRFWRGDCLGAEEHFERGRAFFDVPGFVQLRGLEASTCGTASWLAFVTGRADTARERIRRCIEGTQHPYDLAFGQMWAAFQHAALGEFERAEALAAKAVSQSEERGFPELVLWSLVPLGYARGELGRTGEGIALLRWAVASATASGAHIAIVRQLTWLARIQMLDGAIADALGTIEDALRANPEELAWRPETCRVRGELRLKEGDRSLAETDFREAIALAQKMNGKL